MKQGDILNGRYELAERLGKGPFAETWAAKAADGAASVPPGSELVVKLLSLGDMPDWKGYERFEREAAALKALTHPAIPRYVDSFRLDEGDAHFLALVMERVAGVSLAAELERGRRWTEAEIEELFAQLLSILAYLQSLRPPIIHRDVTPKNLIMKPDGRLALVDFSGVQDAVRLAYRDTSTMVGTAGYAPIEQVSGRASVRSDLYAAAAVASQLLTRKHPSDLPHRELRPDPGALVELSPRLRCVLDNYLSADEAKRTLPPEEAAAILRGERPVPSSGRPPLPGLAPSPEPVFGMNASPTTESFGEPGGNLAGTLPSDSRVTITDKPELFHLAIPRQGLLTPGTLAGGGFVVFWLGFVAFWTFMAVSMRAPVFFPLFSTPFWLVGIFMARSILGPALSAVDLTLSPEGGMVFEERMLRTRTRAWPLADVGACRVENAVVSQRGRRERELVLEVGTRTIRFGRTLSDRERRAIASSINAWLDRSAGR